MIVSIDKRKGFTLIELLVSVAIIVILISLVLGAVYLFRQKATRVSVKAELDQIEVAWKTYLDDYRVFPTDVITEMDVATVDIISGRDVAKNPRRFQYLDVPPTMTDMTDPWGGIYQLRLDDDYDNRVSVPGVGVLNRRVAAWSHGPDGSANTEDDVRSWEN